MSESVTAHGGSGVAPPERAFSGPPLQRVYAHVSDRIAGIPLERGFHPRWLALFGAALSLVLLGIVAVTWLLIRGVGIWGINVPVGWGFDIINFVWWIGIGHAGTLISAILLLLRQWWRTSINRFAEAMTLFAVLNAALFPLLHLGRIWKFYYLFPYPNTMGLWPQWRSPLMWDVFAVLTYSTVSFLFWYLGLIPDFATMRDQARRRWVAVIAGFFSLGWRGSARHWHHYQMLYLMLAGLATPLVVSVHSIVSLDFAVSIVPGWHTTIFPPFFVAGAIYSGFAMVLMLAIPLRSAFRFQDFITTRHLDVMAKVMLTSGLVVAYGYMMETFTGWLSGEEVEHYLIGNRALGTYGPLYWAMIGCNVVAAQTLWFRWVRTHAIPLFIVAVLINVGMWLERFVIVVVSLHRDFLPSSWGIYVPTFWDWSVLIGTLGLFATLMLLFIRFVPMISIFEVREAAHHAGEVGKGRRHGKPLTSVSADSTAQERPRELKVAALAPATALSPQQTEEPEQPLLTGVIPNEKLYGLSAEFDAAETLVDAARQVRDVGYSRVDAFSPFPIAEMPRAIRMGKSYVPRIVLIGALLGAGFAYWLQWYSTAIDYPLNVGGRPYHSWPSYIPLTFELAVLGGVLFGVVGLCVLNRLPQPYHPIFNALGFERASRDSFFLCIEAQDRRFDRVQTRELLDRLKPVRVSEVPL